MSPAGSGWLVASNEDAHGRHILSGSVKCKQWLQIWNISGSVKRHQFLDDGVLWKWWRTIGIEFPCHGRMRHKQNQWYWRRHNLHTGLWTDNDIGICFIIAFIEFFLKIAWWRHIYWTVFPIINSSFELTKQKSKLRYFFLSRYFLISDDYQSIFKFQKSVCFVSKNCFIYEGQSKHTKTFAVAFLLNVVLSQNLVDIITCMQ